MPAKENALDVLKNDHVKVKKLISELQSTPEQNAQKRMELFDEIEREISVHSRIEEEIFYPAFKNACAAQDCQRLYFESTEEHHTVDKVMPDIKKEDPSSPVFMARTKVLKDLIDHHTSEEENDMFPRARQVMDDGQLERLGEQLSNRKQELLQQYSGTA